MKTIATARGYCMLTDPTGDHIAAEPVTDGKVDFSKPFMVKATIAAGTGKYAGISGEWSFIARGPEFKAPEGQYVQYGPIKGNYKLP
jgi:hypothetical protein